MNVIRRQVSPLDVFGQRTRSISYAYNKRILRRYSDSYNACGVCVCCVYSCFDPIRGRAAYQHVDILAAYTRRVYGPPICTALITIALQHRGHNIIAHTIHNRTHTHTCGAIYAPAHKQQCEVRALMRNKFKCDLS